MNAEKILVPFSNGKHFIRCVRKEIKRNNKVSGLGEKNHNKNI